ncbi:MAG TPA: hypothetical protein DIT54_03885 [Lachnospiraceae bacterium]|nr:hypothetical protein [Lachnospiraceae bacterium]HIS63255.1 hypothetical protein [Candidatus Scybalomonas excrementigallinarum]
MVNEKRVKQMSKLAICESRIRKEQYIINSYYQSDYVRLQVLKTLIAITIAYGICLAGYAGLRIEYILDHVMQLDYKKIALIAGGGYVILLLSFFFISRHLAKQKYKQTKGVIEEYDKIIKELSSMYEKEESDNELEERGDTKINDDFTDF